MRRNRWVDELTDRFAPFRRVVVWGHRWGTHTHSYVHAGFARALRALGVDVLWTDDRALLEGLGVSQTLFVTEGQVVGDLPRDPTCRYVLHNVDATWFADIPHQVLLLQTHTLRAGAGSGATRGERSNSYTYAETGDHGVVTLYQPWATDLLPDEFDPAPPTATDVTQPYAAWVGTIGAGRFGNEEQLAGFQKACRKERVEFLHRVNLRLAAHRRLVARSVVAPAIVGAWQLDAGYIPCRIFKNISYGRPGVTNSPVVASIFEEEVPWRHDTAELLALGRGLLARPELVLGQMREVRAKHTYLNRLETIMSYLP